MQNWMLTLLLVAVGLVLPRLALAEGGLLSGARAPLVPLAQNAAAVSRASLFANRDPAGLFAPNGARPEALVIKPNTTARRVRDVIAKAEAGPAGYDAVQHGARIKPPKRPTQMTLGEIYAWIDDTPGQPHAIGRYQFIPKTLRWLADRAGLHIRTRFTPEVQDALADLLLADAGLAEVTAGRLSDAEFMDNLARIWAGLPTASGRSYYHGFAGNKATMTRAEFERKIRIILAG